jgi:hypothetical protein
MIKNCFFLAFTSLVIGFTGCKESVKAEVSVKNDTLKVMNVQDKEDLEKNGFYAQENYVIANKAFLREKPSKSAKVTDTLDFGAKFYTKTVYYGEGEEAIGDESLLENEQKEGFIAVYTKKPKTLSEKPVGYITEKAIVEQYSFQDYKKYFSLPQFKKLDSNIKRAIMENTYINQKTFYLTQNSQKAPNAICTGDFDGDGNKDFAVAIDNVESSESAIVIFCINSATKEPYPAYKVAFTELLKVKTITKGSTITLFGPVENESTDKIVDKDVVQIYGGNSSSYMLYDENTNKFVQY